MSDSEPVIAAPAESWQRLHYRRAAIPGLCLSLVIHAGLVFLLITSLKSYSGVSSGNSQGDYRQVGLVAADASQESPAEEQSNTETPQIEQSTDATELPEVPDRPPTELTTPDLTQDIFGPGSIAPPSGLPKMNNSLLQPAPGEIAVPTALAPGKGAVEFMGLQGNGSTFVYVIDCSGSMGDYKALDFAKAELMASLQGLTAQQKFQVIFYNEHLNVMSLNNERETVMYPATNINLNRAKRFILSFHRHSEPGICRHSNGRWRCSPIRFSF